MVAPWSETAYRVVVEFKKANSGVSRVINLTHRPDVLPTQLYGRVTPEAWRAFMIEVEALSKYHPYVVKQDIGQCCFNLQGLLCFICIGFGMFNPDGGNYNVWRREVSDALAHHQPTFTAGGVNLSLQCVHGSHWIQADIDPNVAVGMAVPPPQPQYNQPQYDTTKPGAYGAPPPGYGQQAPPPGYGQPTGYGQPPGGYPPAAGPSYDKPPSNYPPAGGPNPSYGQAPGGYPPAQSAPAGYDPGPANGWEPPVSAGPTGFPGQGAPSGYPQK